MGQPAFRKNPKTGRLEKLINGKYTAQKSAGFWDWDSKEGKKRNRNNPLRIVRDTIRNVNYEKKRRNKLESKNSSKPTSKPTNKNRSKLTFSQGAKVMESTKKGSTTKTKSKPKDDGGKAAWLKKTRNSPAAKSGAFTDDERWALQQKHRKSKADKTVSKGPSPKRVEITKNKDKFKVAPKDLPTGKVKMKDGSIVDRSSLYEKKKKKKENVPPGTRLSKMFDN